jgi:flagellin
MLPADISDLSVKQANLPSSGTLTLTLTVATPAAKASLVGSNANLSQSFVVEVAGNKGIEVFTFANGTSPQQIVDAVNLLTDSTGVAASLSGSGEYVFESAEYGSDAYVEVRQISSTGTFVGAGSRAYGTDVGGDINGAAFTGKGLMATMRSSSLSLDMNLTEIFASTTGATSFDIVGGGTRFQLGPNVVTNQQVRMSIDSVNTSRLGTTISGQMRRLYELRSGQSAALDTDPTTAYQIVDGAINRVTSLRGNIGAIQSTTLETNIASLNDTLVNLTEAQSNIRDADFAQETARLTRAQILTQSGTSVLKIANQNPQNVLALLPQ